MYKAGSSRLRTLSPSSSNFEKICHARPMDTCIDIYIYTDRQPGDEIMLVLEKVDGKPLHKFIKDYHGCTNLPEAIPTRTQ